MAENEVKKIAQDLIDFLIGHGHSEDRARQIAGNHPDAVRADMEASAKTEPTVVSEAFKKFKDRVNRKPKENDADEKKEEGEAQ